MAPFPETAGLLALRGPAALHLTGWIVTAASLFLPLAVWDERRRSESLLTIGVGLRRSAFRTIGRRRAKSVASHGRARRRPERRKALGPSG